MANPYEVVTPARVAPNPDAPEESIVGYILGPGSERHIILLEHINAGPVSLPTTAAVTDGREIVIEIDENLDVTVVSMDSPTERAEVVTQMGALQGDAVVGETINIAVDDPVIILTNDGLGLVRPRSATSEVDTVLELIVSFPEVRETFYYYTPETIDGSINNTVTGVVEATALATASLATATEFTLPTMDFGDMATTALGAVNTGDITLGVNSAVDEAETTYTNAISAALTQIGGSADTGAIVINVASNANAINGSINNVLNQVNGSIGNISTTALGAVNTVQKDDCKRC